MLNFKLDFLLTILSIITLPNSAYVLDNNEVLPSSSKSVSYNMLTLSQLWPQTSCWDINKKWSKIPEICSPCKMPQSKTSWTLHGLWPSNMKGQDPSYCNYNMKFNLKLLNSQLIAKMEDKWLSYKLTTKNEAFWSHEWFKHGTCAMDIEATNTLPKYFSKAIELLNKYNVEKILSKSAIVPGKKYKFDDFDHAIKNNLKVNADIRCTFNTITKEQYIASIFLCFNKSFILTNCAAETKTDCFRNKDIIYPENLKSC